MSFKNVFLGLGLLLSTVTSSFAGFGLETTRVIYNEQSNNEGFVAFNTDKDTNYLLQSWIEDLNGEVTQNFVITPPLLKLVAQQKNTLQVTKNITLPNDIESMYWINVKFVAPSNKNLENVLRYSMTNKIKLIYRPQLLSNINIEDEVKKLKWSLKNGNMVVTNNTPFFVNIGKIVLNNNEIQDNPGYLPPKSETIIKINKVQSSQNKIQLIYIDDFGKGVPVDFTL
ncbi:molecular chaperone [Proteus terrae]|uniref:fimbrial biogenesis chaperone n=1 Tax=Proteus terrae TaxID=1574161 RepID=UPI0021BB6FF1|nr:molecular chaperone [Proteus terrae]MCT8264574.1 molecular chaperone [Proteus terrae]